MLPVEDPKKVSRLVLMAQMSEIAERLAYSVDYPHIGHQQRQILMAFPGQVLV